MVEITNANELEVWLQHRPREDAVLIAARAALRAFPLLAPMIESNAETNRVTILLPVLRASAVASVAGTWPTRTAELLNAARAAEAFARAGDQYAAHASYAASYAVYAKNYAFVAKAAADATADAATVGVATANAPAATNATISADAMALEGGTNHAALAATRLWPDGAPDWIREPWHMLRDHLLAAGDDWFVWVDWYQDRLDGKPANEDLEVAKALIQNEMWRDGPAVVNAEIARLINEHKRAVGTTKATVETLLERPNRLYALADWALIDQLMQLQPFDSDYLKLDDLSTIRARDQLLEQLFKQVGFLRDDVTDEGYNARWATRLIRSLDRYFEEASKTARHAIPGLLMKHGSDLRACFLDEETASTLPESLRNDLEAIVQLHSRLVQSYLTPTLARMQGRADLILPDTLTPDMIVDLVERAVSAIQNDALAQLHDADQNGKAVLREQADSLRDLQQRRDDAQTSAERERLDSQIKKEGTTTVETIIQLVARSAKAKADFTGYLANLKTLLGDNFKDVWETILELFTKT
ncbi:MAG: hypothetical protein ACFB03_01795 [Paracoccaceae bacterium]